MHAIIVWGEPEKAWLENQILDIKQNAIAHGLVLDVLPVKQCRNNPDVKYFIGKDLS